MVVEAITMLCKNGLDYQTEFTVEGLLGITLDKKEVFLVNIKESIQNCNAPKQMADTAPFPPEAHQQPAEYKPAHEEVVFRSDAFTDAHLMGSNFDEGRIVSRALTPMMQGFKPPFGGRRRGWRRFGCMEGFRRRMETRALEDVEMGPAMKRANLNPKCTNPEFSNIPVDIPSRLSQPPDGAEQKMESDDRTNKTNSMPLISCDLTGEANVTVKVEADNNNKVTDMSASSASATVTTDEAVAMGNAGFQDWQGRRRGKWKKFCPMKTDQVSFMRLKFSEIFF